MKRIAILGVLVALSWFVQPVFAASSEEALSDWTKLVEVSENEGRQLGDYRAGFIVDDFEIGLKSYEEFEKTALLKVKQILETITKKYGSTPEEIDTKMKALVPQSGNLQDPGPTFKRLKADYDVAVGVRKETAVILLQRADERLQTVNFLDESIRQDGYLEVKQLLELAVKYDPQNKDAKEKLASIDKTAASAFAALEKQRDAQVWPPRDSKKFNGPGDPNKLRAAAETFLRGDQSWSREKLIAVHIKGDWWPVEKDFMGRPTVWGLPVYVAVEDKNDKRNARVFSLSMLTQPTGKKELPFVGAAVGNYFSMRQANIKGASDGGLFSAIFWLGLVLVNIVGGLLVMAPWVTKKIPQSAAGYARIEPVRNLIGVTAIIIGSGSF